MKLRQGLTALVRVRTGRVSLRLALRQLGHWQSGSDDLFYFRHRNFLFRHNRFSALFFSMKVEESEKIDLVSLESCIIDFKDKQVWI
jgi:hypothetical protein